MLNHLIDATYCVNYYVAQLTVSLASFSNIGHGFMLSFALEAKRNKKETFLLLSEHDTADRWLLLTCSKLKIVSAYY